MTGLNLNYEPEIVVDIRGLTREEWLDYRKKGIGGSDVAAIMGISPFATIRDLYNNKVGILPAIPEEEESNWVAKEVGHRLEDLVAEIFVRKTGLKVFPVRKMFRHPLYPFMLADVDFFISFSDGTYGILECKTCNYNASKKWDDDAIPDNYVLQVKHYLSVMNMQKAYIACLYGNNEDEFVFRYLERDLMDEEDLIEQEAFFWEKYVEKHVEPPYNGKTDLTVALYSTQDTSVPLSARDKYLASRKMIGFTAVGYNLPLTDQIELEMEGAWENGSHGLQYRVESFMEIVPRTKEGIIGYLASGAIKGVRQRTAEAIYHHFGLDTLEIIEKTPAKLLSVPGISEKKLYGIMDSFGKNRVFRELMTFLAPYKVTPKKVNMILQTFKDESVDIIRKRPYMLCAVKGFGFLTVDNIGRALGKTLNDPMRISGCISYVLSEAMKEGHLYLEWEILTEQVLEVLNKDLTFQAVTAQNVSNVFSF